MASDAIDLGPFTGDAAPAWRDDEHLRILRELPRHLPADTSPDETPERERRRAAILRIELAGVPVAVKVFGEGSAKARRSWEVGRALQAANIGTPEPFAYLEGEGAAYHLSAWLDDISSFNRQLLHLIHHEFQYDKILNLMDVVAAEVRRMHDAGIRHGDMGNQNIVCRRAGDEQWSDVGFLDLNRGRVRDELTMEDRAFDCSRLTLPSRLLKNFLSMYWRDRYRAGQRPPKEFTKHLQSFRKRFAFHSKTRKWRHPIRTWRKSRTPDTKPRYPAPKDFWVWDTRTHQAIGVLMKKDRLPLMPIRQIAKTGLIAAKAYRPAKKRFETVRASAFQQPASMKDGIGMTLTPDPRTIDLERKYLADLGVKLPILLRFYHHESEADWDFVAGVARDLHNDGHSIAAALIQSRKPGWHAFVSAVFDRIGDIVTEVEIGHAINRTKWGLWSVKDYLRLLQPWPAMHAKFPNVRLLGPAVNDFEFHYLVGALAQVPKNITIDAASLHLYVDRRGAPENTQRVLGGEYNALDKFAWARAVSDEVIISEVNWPLKDPGHYMPEFAPYFWHGNPSLDTTVTEDEYGWYMVRYYLLAIASGLVKRVYWWHLASPLFGLVDTTVEGWRARPAHAMLKQLLRHASDATCVGRESDGWLLHFEKPNGERFSIGWTVEGEVPVQASYARAENATGDDVAPTTLSPAPTYLFPERA